MRKQFISTVAIDSFTAIKYQIDRALSMIILDNDIRSVSIEVDSDILTQSISPRSSLLAHFEKKRTSSPHVGRKSVNIIAHTPHPKKRHVAPGKTSGRCQRLLLTINSKLVEVKYKKDCSNPFSDTSKGLWKTLRNALRIRKTKPQHRDGIFVAITNGRVPDSCLVREMTRAHDQYMIECRNTQASRKHHKAAQKDTPQSIIIANSCVRKLRATQSGNREIAKYIAQVKEYPDEDIISLIRNLRLIDEPHPEDPSTEKKAANVFFPSDKNPAVSYSDLKKWFFSLVFELWDNNRPATITRDDLLKAVLRIRRNREDPDRPRPRPPVDDLVIQNYKQHTFVRKLQDTGVNVRQLIHNAIESYIQYSEERLRLKDDCGYIDDDFNEYTLALQQLNWKPKYDAMCLEFSGRTSLEDRKDAGRKVYQSAITAPPPNLGGSVVRLNYLILGGLHHVADMDDEETTLWWLLREQDVMEDE